MIQHASPERRARTLRRIGTFFLAGLGFWNDGHIRLFDQVLSRLIADADISARSELARRLAPLDNAPLGVIRLLARDDAIAVAGPVLKQSRRVAEDDLVDIARSRGQAHLLAISRRASIGAPVSDLLVRRGGREVLRSVAENRGARLSDHSFFALVERAQGDGVLAEKVGLRPDIPPRLFSNLLQNASGKAPLHASARPPTAFETLRQQDRLDEAAVVDFANTGRYQEMIAALVWLCAVPIEVLDRLMGSERPDPIFILCKSMDWEWSTAKAILMARPDNASSADLDAAIADFNRLSPSTARRVRRFWQFRMTEDAAPNKSQNSASALCPPPSVLRKIR